MDFDYGELRKRIKEKLGLEIVFAKRCLLYTSPSPRDS